jgi:hypothetical protein
MLRLLTNKLWREYNHHEVLIHTAAARRASLMNIQTTQQRKEVTTLDADVPLLRPTLIRLNVSELRLFKTQADRFEARHFGLLGAV